MTSPSEQVAASFIQAKNYADEAQSKLGDFTAALNAAIYAAPAISLKNDMPQPPKPFAPPPDPYFDPIAYVAPVPPAQDAINEPEDPKFEDFKETMQALSTFSVPSLNYGSAPAIPAIGEVTMPDAPVLDAIAAPEYLSLAVVEMDAIDLHSDYLAKLEDIPVLELLKPMPYTYTRGPAYASGLLSGLKATLTARLAGGTGLSPAIEQAIWGRARDRETKIALANEAEVMRGSTAFGFALPSGALAAQLREAQQTYYGKLAGLSRDVSIRQAEMEVENLKQTISQGMELESKLLDYSSKMEQLAFDAAKVAAESAIQAYNAQVDGFKALLTAYQIYAGAYDTIIKGELAKVDVFKARLQGEQVKVEMNKTMTDQLKAFTDAQMTRVKVYESQIAAANSLVNLEQIKISAAGEQIKAYGIRVNAETAKVEAYKASIQGEQSKVDIYKVKADAFSAVTNAKAEFERVKIAHYSAIMQTRTAEWDRYRTEVDIEKIKMQTTATQNDSRLNFYKASLAASEAESNASTRQWETSVKAYEASQSLVIQLGKANNDVLVANRASQADAAKAGAQVYAQLAASAYGMINAQASVSGSDSTSFNYSGSTSDSRQPAG